MTLLPLELFAGIGVGELQKYLEDPMSDPDVRRDEETRATTVEHVKLLSCLLYTSPSPRD